MKVLLQFVLEEVGGKSVEGLDQIVFQQSFVDNLDFQQWVRPLIINH